jgi:hypothetical protein
LSGVIDNKGERGDDAVSSHLLKVDDVVDMVTLERRLSILIFPTSPFFQRQIM